jgi:putative intracellular protease/amidase
VRVVFATERQGTVPAADPRLLTGVLFGQLGAAPAVKSLYAELTKVPEFSATLAWDELDPVGFDGLLLPGGHAPGMRQYLGSPALCDQVGQFWQLGRPVGAICHGVLVLARTRPVQARAADPIRARRRDRGQLGVYRAGRPLPVRALAR